MRPPGRPPASEPNPVQRGLLGAVAGWFAALLVAALRVGAAEPSPAWPVFLVTLLGAAAGTVVGVVAGARELRGAAAHSLMGGLVGAIAGCLVGAGAVIVAIGSRWDLAAVFFVPIALGAALGALGARVRHGGRITLAEGMGWVAAIAFALALLATFRRS